MKTHVRGFFDTDLHEVSWHFATHEAVRPSVGLLGTDFSEILIESYTFSPKKMHFKMSSRKWQPYLSLPQYVFCLTTREFPPLYLDASMYLVYSFFTDRSLIETRLYFSRADLLQQTIEYSLHTIHVQSNLIIIRPSSKNTPETHSIPRPSDRTMACVLYVDCSIFQTFHCYWFNGTHVWRDAMHFWCFYRFECTMSWFTYVIILQKLSKLRTKTVQSMQITPNLQYKSHQTRKLKCFSSRLGVVFVQSSEAWCFSRPMKI